MFRHLQVSNRLNASRVVFMLCTKRKNTNNCTLQLDSRWQNIFPYFFLVFLHKILYTLLYNSNINTRDNIQKKNVLAWLQKQQHIKKSQL